MLETYVNRLQMALLRCPSPGIFTEKGSQVKLTPSSPLGFCESVEKLAYEADLTCPYIPHPVVSNHSSWITFKNSRRFGSRTGHQSRNSIGLLVCLLRK